MDEADNLLDSSDIDDEWLDNKLEESKEELVTGDDENVPVPQNISLGLSPTGLIGISVNDTEGTKVAYFIDDPAEAWQIAGHLLSLATMMVQARYAIAFKEQEMIQEMLKKQKLYVPGQ